MALPKGITIEEFFKIASKMMAEKLHIQPDEMLEMFHKREKESSTVLNPDLAIPHIIIEGKHIFDILLVRCKEGIYFSESTPKIHTVFVIIGTRDERTFHLQSLAAIAQIVQDPHFEDKWMTAKNEEALRDIILLGKRKRHHS